MARKTRSKFAFTQRRKKWIGSRSVVMRGLPLRNNAVIQARYVKRLDNLASRMVSGTQKAVRDLIKSKEGKAYFAQDASISSQARIVFNALNRDWKAMLDELAPKYARDMINQISGYSASSLKLSLEELSGGLTINTDLTTGILHEIIKASVQENILYIKSIQDDYMKNVEGAVMRSITAPDSGGTKELIESIDKMLDSEAKKIHNKARNIALDQTRKAYTNLNAGRMIAAGVDKYEWRHSGGSQTPRPLHKHKLNGQIFSLKNPPIIDERTGERGIPGQAINCKCIMLPVIEFDDGTEDDEDDDN
jgi:SPP1 gp7 family putative phage head morphogenesis protein